MRTLLIWLVSFSAALTALHAEPLIEKDDLSDCSVQGAGDAWTFGGGMLTGRSVEDLKGSILWTKRTFKNFYLKGQFRYTGAEADSGIFLRTEVDQIQIGKSRSLKRDMTGSPYISTLKTYPVEAKAKAALGEGSWNDFTITARGGHYVVLINGKEVLNWVSETAIPEGPIGFQIHADITMKIEFRNLEVSSIE
jgi:hypothetical protein